MHRRTLLRRVPAVACATTLSGCTTHSLREAERDPPAFEGVREEAVDLPVRQRLAVAAAAIEGTATDDIEDLEAFASRLEAEGLSVEHLDEAESHGEPILSLESVDEPSVERGAMHHLGVVAGTYAAAVAAGEDREALEVTLLDEGAEPYGEYEVRRHWAESYDDGEYTARTYAKEVAVTLAST